MKVLAVAQSLDALALNCKQYFRVPKTSYDSGAYLAKMWTARANKENAKKFLPKRKGLEYTLGHEVFSFLYENGVIGLVFIEEGEYRNEHCVLMPLGLKLVNTLLSAEKDLEFEPVLVLPVIKDISKAFYYDIVPRETLSRIQTPLRDSDDLGAKPSVFALFLLLAGAVSEDTAFILSHDENKEINYQEEIVLYLNDLCKAIFLPGNMRGKEFSVGDLSNFIRRSKDLRVAYGGLFKKEEDRIYFDLENENGALDGDALRQVISITLARLTDHADLEGGIEEPVFKASKQYFLDDPIKQAHRASLFAGRASPQYNFTLNTAISAYFQTHKEEVAEQESTYEEG